MALCRTCSKPIPCHCHLSPPIQIRPGAYLADDRYAARPGQPDTDQWARALAAAAALNPQRPDAHWDHLTTEEQQAYRDQSARIIGAQPDTDAEAQQDETPGPWLVQKICCGRDDGQVEFATWAEADGFREEYIDSARIADHERTAILRAARETRQDGAQDGEAVHPGGNAEDCPVCRPQIDKTVLYPWICPGPTAVARPGQPDTDRKAQ